VVNADGAWLALLARGRVGAREGRAASGEQGAIAETPRRALDDVEEIDLRSESRALGLNSEGGVHACIYWRAAMHAMSTTLLPPRATVQRLV